MSTTMKMDIEPYEDPQIVAHIILRLQSMQLIAQQTAEVEMGNAPADPKKAAEYIFFRAVKNAHQHNNNMAQFKALLAQLPDNGAWKRVIQQAEAMFRKRLKVRHGQYGGVAEAVAALPALYVDMITDIIVNTGFSTIID